MTKAIIEKAKYVKHLESVEKTLKERVKVLQDDARAVASQYSKLRDEIISELEDIGLSKVTDGSTSITMSDSPFSVIITNEDAVPSEYKKEVITISIDKKALIADKPEIEGIDFIQSKKLTIKV